MRISVWSSHVCSSCLLGKGAGTAHRAEPAPVEIAQTLSFRLILAEHTGDPLGLGSRDLREGGSAREDLLDGPHELHALLEVMIFIATGELHEFGPFHRGKRRVDPCPLFAIIRQDRTLRPRLACSRLGLAPVALGKLWRDGERSEEHTSELQSLMRI